MATIRLPDGREIENPWLTAINRDKATQSRHEAYAKLSPEERLGKLGKANYSWANPQALMGTKYNQYNAKTMPYQGAHGVGLANYGWNEGNILDKIKYSRDMYNKGDKSGGYKEIYQNMEKWANKNDPRLKTFLQGGPIPEGLTMDTVLQAADYGLRGTARKQQNKRGFFDKGFGKILGTVATIAASIVNPALGAAVGAGIGAMRGGWKGALIGGASAYAGAKFGGGFTGTSGNIGTKLMGGLKALRPGWLARAGSGLGGAGGAAGSTASNYALSSAAPNLWGGLNFAQGVPLGQLGGTLPGISMANFPGASAALGLGSTAASSGLTSGLSSLGKTFLMGQGLRALSGGPQAQQAQQAPPGFGGISPLLYPGGNLYGGNQLYGSNYGGNYGGSTYNPNAQLSSNFSTPYD